MPKVAIVTNLFTPYRKRQFDLINRGIHGDLHIFFTDKSAPDRKWQIVPEDNYHFLPKLLSVGKFGSLSANLPNIARNHDCVVIGGWEQPTYLLLALLCQVFRTPYMLIIDGIPPSRIRHQGNPLTRRIKRWIIGNSAACFANGKVSHQYIVDVLGLPQVPLYNQYLSVDETAIVATRPNRNILRDEFLHTHELPDTSALVLYSGRLIARKRIDDLIRALINIPDAVLITAGHGPEEYALRSLATQLNIRSVFLNHLEQDRLAEIYVIADCLVLPSTDEPWGLVVNEALFAGIPVVASSDCGCAADLVRDGENGFVFNTGKIAELTDRIAQALSLDLNKIQKMNTELIKTWNLENSTKSFIEMLSMQSKNNQNQPSLQPKSKKWAVLASHRKT